MIGLYLFLIFVSLFMIIEISLTDEQQAFYKLEDKSEEDRDNHTDSFSTYQKLLLVLFNMYIVGCIVFMVFLLIKAFS